MNDHRSVLSGGLLTQNIDELFVRLRALAVQRLHKKNLFVGDCRVVEINKRLVVRILRESQPLNEYLPLGVPVDFNSGYDLSED